MCVTALQRKQETYLLDVTRGRWDFPTLRRRVIDLAREYNADHVLIEDAVSAQPLIQQLRAEQPVGVPKPQAIKASTVKVVRFSGQTAMIERGELLLPKEAFLLADFEKEILGFP